MRRRHTAPRSAALAHRPAKGLRDGVAAKMAGSDMTALRRWAVYWLIWIGMVAVIGVGLTWLGLATARAQSGQHGDGHAQHHDWYRLLKTPHGYSCCQGDQAGKMGDCRPVQARPTDGGGWEVYFGGRWHPVPPERILPGHLNKAPLHSHLCEQDGYIRCMIPGGSGT